jgi:hypothetical protein
MDTTGPGGPPHGFTRSRLHNFGLTMVIMGASFILYYLGLFGTVEGPLTPANLGASLSSLGVTQRHVILMLLALLIGAITWNWIFNLTRFVAGRRMTCLARSKDADGFCGAPSAACPNAAVGRSWNMSARTVIGATRPTSIPLKKGWQASRYVRPVWHL